MIRKKEECRYQVNEHFKDGEGEFRLQHVVDTEELAGHGRLFAKGSLPPGSSVGNHTHNGDMEICYFLSGEGKVIDDGTEYKVGPGDVNVTYSGHAHEIINTGRDDLTYMALVLYTQQ